MACCVARDFPQFLLVGGEGEGKTTLLYKLKMGNSWKKEEIVRDFAKIKEDSGLHYEELYSGGRYGIWDVSGKKTSRDFAWPLVYRYLAFDAVLFVVEAEKVQDHEGFDAQQDLATSINWMRFLCQEEELRHIPLVVGCYVLVVRPGSH